MCREKDADSGTRSRPPRPPATEVLHFGAFVTILLDWIHRWNTEYPKRFRDGRIPAQAWADDPTPIYDVDPVALHTYTLEDTAAP
ncbi:hypothetical protein T261_8580 [Streptomyces lydicus]|nr:hypothetical protein T261_8580 [Streptomyces lydicus]